VQAAVAGSRKTPAAGESKRGDSRREQRWQQQREKRKASAAGEQRR
jgi:hypothetical protein